MNKTAIKNFAIWARVQLIEAAKQRAFEYEITEDGENRADIDSIGGIVLTAEVKEQRRQLISQIQHKGYTQVMEEAAYTWFNRFIALRFMEVNGYLPSKTRVFTDENGEFKPEILKQAMSVEIDGLDRNKVLQLLDAQANEELYKYLIITQCNALNESLPEMFETISNWTELLFPTNLLRSDSVLARMVADIPEEDWRDAVQIIGWLYQYYIFERHEEVIDPIHGKTIKKEDIPAATQLFTTDWVVRYMVDNSLGRYWIERHPESKLAEKLEFFVTPKNGEIKHIDEFVNPEDVKFIDPCMGSGHVLVYAFDVLMEIYKESGYAERDAASMIVQNNLFGLDIDDRASQLAYFAVMMKARSYDRRFLSRGITPNVISIKESNHMGVAIRDGLTTDADMNVISRYLVDTFRDAKELGSIITAEPKDYDSYIAYLDGCAGQGQLTMDDSDWLQNTRPMLKALARQSKVLAAKYSVVCTNPPYLNKIEGRLKSFVTENYKDYSGDLFSVFIYRNLMLCKQDGYSGYMTPNVWMFIKTYEKLRGYIINEKSIISLIQMAKGAFFKEATVDICTFILKNTKGNKKGLYFRLENFKGDMEVQKQKVLEALADKSCGYFYEADQSNFSKIPGSPVAYWASLQMQNAFATAPSFPGNTKKGVLTGDNERFLRLWHEVCISKIGMTMSSHSEMVDSKKKWFPVTSGGFMRKWYGNFDTIVNLENDGFAIRSVVKNYRLREPAYYFREAVTWTEVSSGIFSCRYVPHTILFGNGGPVSFFSNDNLYYCLALLNSSVTMSMLAYLAPTVNYGPEQINKLPVLTERKNTVDNLSKDNVKLSQQDWDSYETSWDFKRNPLV